MQPSARSSSVGIPAMAICIFAVYISSLSPSIAGGDSGELVAEGCALGTAHPPGYPLFTLMVFLIKLCADPLGIEVAYGVNVSSAILTVGAACLIGQVVSRAGCTGGTLPGVLLSMGMFSFSPLIWQYATTAEVFPLNTFFMALLVYLVVQFEYDRREWIVRSGALLCGVALCNQHTAVLYEAPLILWILYLHREKIKATPSLLAVYSLLFVAGLAIYGYLPIAANIVDSPGGWGDVKTLKGIIHHMLRRDYGTFQLYSGNSGKQAESMIERTVAYLEDLHSMQGLCVAPILAFVGVVYWARSVPAGLEHAKIGEGAEPGSNAKRVASCRAALHKPSLTLARDMGQYTPTIIAATQVFYFVVFHSLSNLPLSDKLLYGIHQRFW